MLNSYQQSDQFLSVNGVQLHYVLEGDKEKPVLALINMASHNLTCWDLVMEPLLQHFRVLRFDIRGTGKSSGGEEASYRFSQYGNDLIGLMDALGLERALVTAMAYGSRTLARVVLEHPQRLIGACFFDTALTPPVKQSRQHDLAHQAQQMLRDAGESLPQLHKHWRFYENRDSARLAHTAHEQEPDLTESLSSVTLPVLVACGEQDVNFDESRRIAKQMPQAQFASIPMAGHASVFFRPEQFVDLVVNFYHNQCTTQ